MASQPVRSGWLLRSGAARCLRFGQTRWRSVRFAQRADRVRRAEGRALADLSVLCDRTQPRRDLREVLGLPRVTAGVSGTREHRMRCVAHGVAGANHRAPVLAFVRPPGLCLPQVLCGRARGRRVLPAARASALCHTRHASPWHSGERCKAAASPSMCHACVLACVRESRVHLYSSLRHHSARGAPPPPAQRACLAARTAVDLMLRRRRS